jgi:RNA polymerase sigma-70 factor (ECF subfamily)
MAFAATRWSQVSAAAGDDPAARLALDALCRAYWEPLLAHARRRGWRDADDAVQDFWVMLMERGALGRADPARGRFRTWLLACLDHHLEDRAAAAGALRRGGGRGMVDVDGDDQPAVAPASDPAAGFDRAWALTLLARARQRLAGEQRDGERERFRRLEPFLAANGDATAYAAAGRDLGLTEGAVKVAVHRLRAAFRDAVRAEIADTLADPTPTETDAELAVLLEALTGR